MVISSERGDRVADGHDDPRVEANTRLTTTTGAVLFVLLAAEGVTLLSVGSLLSWHAFIGVMLIPIAGLKLATTGRRFVAYYRGDPAFRRKGPPHPILRILGPFVSLLTILLLASGTVLVVGGRAYDNPWRTIHTITFYVWLAAMTVHVLGHILETVRIAPLDWTPRASRVGSGAYRRTVLVAVIVVGVAGGLLVQTKVRSWHHGQRRDRFRAVQVSPSRPGTQHHPATAPTQPH